MTKMTIENGELVNYERCFGDATCKFVGLAEGLEYSNDCVLLHAGKAVPAVLSGLKKVKINDDKMSKGSTLSSSAETIPPTRNCGCGKPAVQKCKKSPNGGWGTMKCGAPLCSICRCDCDEVLIF